MSSKNRIIDVCKLCLQEKELLESHIMPRQVYKQSGLLAKYEPIKVINATRDKVETITDRTFDGVKYSLCCKSCENIMGTYESYFGSVFYQPTIAKSLGITVAEKSWEDDMLRQYTGLNYTYIKLYYLSIFYKMSISNHKEHLDMTLGEKHNEIIRKLVLNGDPGSDEAYKIMRIRPITREKGKGIMFPLKLNRLENNQGYYWLGFFGAGQIMFKVSSNGVIPYNLNSMFEEFRIKPDGTMTEWLMEDNKWKRLTYDYIESIERQAKRIKI